MPLIRREIPVPPAFPAPRSCDGVSRAIDAARRRDPVGHRVHVVLAALHLAMLPLTTAGSAISFALLLFYVLLRLPNTWWLYPALGRAALPWLLAAWAAWHGISAAWSVDPAQGWDEVEAMRAFLTPVMLWPVIECAPLLVTAAVAGVVAQAAMQLAQVVGVLDVRTPGRIGGLIHPTQTGAWCLAALCWCGSAALRGRGRVRAVAIGTAAIAGLAMVATGSRGPWIAAALVLPALLVVVALRRPEARRSAILVAALAVVLGGVAWPFVGARVVERLDVAAREVRRAVEEGEYGSSAGSRVGMWRWAATLWREHPVIGVGAGAYFAEASALPEYGEAVARRPRGERWFNKAHPHSVSMHVLATSGAIGAAIVLALLVVLLRGAWRVAPTWPGSDGTLFAALGWIVGGQFDAYHLNGHLLGLLGLLAALALPNLPAARGTWRADDAEATPRAS